MIVKFAEHFYYIAAAMNKPGQEGMWDDEDGFYYDILRLPDGSATRLKVRSMVGLLPLCATTVTEAAWRERMPRAMAQVAKRLLRMPELSKTIHPTGPGHYGVADRGILALVNPERLRRILTKMLVEHRHVRRQFQLAGTYLDAGERRHHPGPPAVLPVLWRQLQN